MIWKKISTDPNYEISDDGTVRSLDRVVPFIQRNQYGEYQTTKTLKGKTLKNKVMPNGYLISRLPSGDIYTHRLVAREFIGDIDNMEINHIDGCKSNNSVDNLEIVTRTENQDHAYDSGLNQHFDKSIPVMVNGRKYVSLGEASRAENIPKGVLYERLRNPNPKTSGNFKYVFTLSRM